MRKIYSRAAISSHFKDSNHICLWSLMNQTIDELSEEIIKSESSPARTKDVGVSADISSNVIKSKWRSWKELNRPDRRFRWEAGVQSVQSAVRAWSKSGEFVSAVFFRSNYTHTLIRLRHVDTNFNRHRLMRRYSCSIADGLSHNWFRIESTPRMEDDKGKRGNKED